MLRGGHGGNGLWGFFFLAPYLMLSRRAEWSPGNLPQATSATLEVSYLFKNIFTTVMVCLHVVVMVFRNFNNLKFNICALIQQLDKS